jgi:hypothetical protein
MKIKVLLLICFPILGLSGAYCQCTSEKGYYDFPFTQNGLTVNASGTGGYTHYSYGSYTSCGVTTKDNSVWIGQFTAATFTNTFSQPVNDMVYNFIGADDGEVMTITVNSGTPTITYIEGTCPEAMTISGNVITMASGFSDIGGRIKIHSTSGFTSISFSHNGGSGGTAITMCFDGVFASITGATVSTTAVTATTTITATSGGNVTNDGGATVTAKGICWNATGSPTISDSHTNDGTGLGSFTSSLTNLSPNTTYYLKAYATNSSNIRYGSQVVFTTLSIPLIITAPTLASKVYDGTTDASSVTTPGTVSGKVSGDDVTVNIETSVFDTKNAGTGKTVTVTYSLNGADVAKYAAPAASIVATGIITTRRVTVTADAGKTKVYGQVDPVLTFTDTPALIGSDNFTGALSRASGENVGSTYAINLGTLSAGTNYNISFVSKDFTITQKSLSNYNDATIGLSKTITVVYTLSGSAAANYIAPVNLLINAAKISEKIVLNNMSLTTTAGCEGSNMELSYTVLNGAPVQYQIVFGSAALSAGFQNISFTSASSSSTGVVDIPIPSHVPYGNYQATLQMRNELGVVSDLYPFSFVVNLSTDYIIPKYDDVVLCDNHTNSFSSYQWYKNGTAISGATGQYYKDPNGLVGSYSLKLKTVTGQDLQICSKVLNIPKAKKVSVNVYPNPMRANQESTVKISGMSDEEMQGAVMSVYNVQGVQVYATRNVVQINSLTLSGLNGAYVSHIITAKGNDYVYRILLVQ